MADLTQLNRLYCQVDELHRRNLPDIFREVEGPARDREYMQVVMGDGEAALLVAELEKVLVGVVQVTLRETPPIPILVPRRTARVEDLVIDKGHRCLGIGRMLLAAAEDWALSRGANETELFVFEFNEGARAFYECSGYETSGRRLSRRLPRLREE